MQTNHFYCDYPWKKEMGTTVERKNVCTFVGIRF